jgi:DNA-directed RNA polymerase specialized sigma24 family protein
MMRRIRSRSDAQLLQDTPADPEAFAKFYRRHERAVLGCFSHWCRDPELVVDLMAETFAEAFESAPRYRVELGDGSAGLFGIGRHVLLRSVRRGRVQDETRRRLGMRPAAKPLKSLAPYSFAMLVPDGVAKVVASAGGTRQGAGPVSAAARVHSNLAILTFTKATKLQRPTIRWYDQAGRRLPTPDTKH